jgi:hypothetical protein
LRATGSRARAGEAAAADHQRVRGDALKGTA